MKWYALFAGIFLAGSLFFVACSKKSAPKMAGPKTFDWDKGPTDIDAYVAKYPKDLQATYHNIIEAKCTQCHALGRVIWAPYYDQALWTKIATKMANRPGSQVSSDEVPSIVKFLVYDHAQRKAQIEKMFMDNHWNKEEPVGLQ